MHRHNVPRTCAPYKITKWAIRDPLHLTQAKAALHSYHYFMSFIHNTSGIFTASPAGPNWQGTTFKNLVLHMHRQPTQAKQAPALFHFSRPLNWNPIHSQSNQTNLSFASAAVMKQSTQLSRFSKR